MLPGIHRGIITLCLLSSGLFSACNGPRLTAIQIDDVTARVTVAEDEASRANGLSGRQHLDNDEGLLMVFPVERIQKVWMLNMAFAIDVGFFDADGRLLNVLSLQPDHGLQTYASAAPARFVLEMNRGWFKRHGLRQNAKLTLPSGISAQSAR